jgi:hypothetical protein
MLSRIGGSLAVDKSAFERQIIKGNKLGVLTQMYRNGCQNK